MSKKDKKGKTFAHCVILLHGFQVRWSQSITARKSTAHLSKVLTKFTVHFKITSMFNPDICIEICPVHIFIWLNNFSHNKDVLVKQLFLFDRNVSPLTDLCS